MIDLFLLKYSFCLPFGCFLIWQQQALVSRPKLRPLTNFLLTECRSSFFPRLCWHVNARNRCQSCAGRFRPRMGSSSPLPSWLDTQVQDCDASQTSSLSYHETVGVVGSVSQPFCHSNLQIAFLMHSYTRVSDRLVSGSTIRQLIGWEAQFGCGIVRHTAITLSIARCYSGAPEPHATQHPGGPSGLFYWDEGTTASRIHACEMHACERYVHVRDVCL